MLHSVLVVYLYVCLTIFVVFLGSALFADLLTVHRANSNDEPVRASHLYHRTLHFWCILFVVSTPVINIPFLIGAAGSLAETGLRKIGVIKA